MKIILLGAPGAGKTSLAKSLAKKLDGTTTIVDGYVEKLGKATDEEYGIYANYGMNLQAAVARLTAEKEAKQKGTDHTIVCGSSIESLVYNTLRTNRDIYWNKDDEQTQRTLFQIGEGTSMGIGVLIATSIDTSELFLYLPLSEKQIDEKGKTYEVAVDKMLPEAIESLHRPFLTIEGSRTEKVSKAFDTATKYQRYLDDQNALAQGQGVSESGGTDQEDRFEAQPVPDVQGQPD